MGNKLSEFMSKLFPSLPRGGAASGDGRPSTDWTTDGAMETVSGCLYDTVVPCAPEIHAFRLPVGLSEKTLDDTNLLLESMIPSGCKFRVRSVSAKVLPWISDVITAEEFADLRKIVSGTFMFCLNGKILLTLPLSEMTDFSTLTVKGRLFVSACRKCGRPVAEEKEDKGDRAFDLVGPVSAGIIIPGGFPFWGRLSWSDPPSKSNRLRLKVVLRGEMEMPPERAGVVG